MDQNKNPSPTPTSQAGKPIKTLPGWVGLIVLLVFLFIFFITGAWLFLPILIPVAIWYWRSYKKQQSALQAFAKKHGFMYQGMTNLNDLDGVIFQGPAHILGQGPGASSGYPVNWLVYGKVADLNFRAYEYAYSDGSGPSNSDSQEGMTFSSGNHATSNFLVMDLNVQGEGLEFLLVSKTNPTALKNIAVSLRKYQLEGDFGKYFELYAPENAEIETLRIFTPDIMADLIDNYQEYNIELTPQHLFLYRDAGSFAKTTDNLGRMLQAATNLSLKFFAGIERVDFSKENIVSPALTAKTNRSRIAGKFSLTAVVLVSLAATLIAAGIIYLTNEDKRIPQGYLKATDAKVIENKTVEDHCQANKVCRPNYQITATFTDAENKPYWYRDTLIHNYSVDSVIDLYFNPANPAQAKFVGGKSSSAATPIVAVIWVISLGGIWAIYYFSRKN